MSEIKVNKVSPRSGTALTVGDSGDTITIPTGAGLTVTDEVKTNKISPASGTAFTLGDSGDTFTVPAGATITNSGTATGFGGGKVLQVLQAVKTDTFSTAASSYTDLTGITLDITPSATSSKILVMTQLSMAATNGGQPTLQLLRDSTPLNLGAAASSRTRATTTFFTEASWEMTPVSIIYLDSPSSTSALTYKVQGFAAGSNTIYLNRSVDDADDAAYYRAGSSIVLMEIGA
tara:strand:+ start:22 stop:720 length:699 start_codon:yes stop_codon:yes gene_type:complete